VKVKNVQNHGRHGKIFGSTMTNILMRLFLFEMCSIFANHCAQYHSDLPGRRGTIGANGTVANTAHPGFARRLEGGSHKVRILKYHCNMRCKNPITFRKCLI